MAAVTWVLFCLAAVWVTSSLAEQKSCYAKNDNPYLLFGSKTAYEFVKDKAKPEDIPDCEPAQIWLIARHGTRYPEKKYIKEMKDLPELREQILRNHRERQDGSLCEDDLENFRRWSLDVSVNQAEELTNQGERDMEFIARRYKSRFPALLTQSYDMSMFNFRYTNTQRTRASAEAFAMGLFGGEPGSIRLPPPMDNDTLIHPSANCTTWLKESKNARIVEQELFINGSLMMKMRQDVSNRLGFKYTLADKQIFLMYDMCRYDKSWNVNELSAWCAAFNKTDLMLLEYSEDLKFYYRQGFGNDMSAKLGCPLVQDLIQKFSKLEADNSLNEQPHGVFYFSHSVAVQTMLTALGIGRDIIKPDHSNYELVQKREFRMSKMGPFASNLAAVFFQCSKGDPHRVMFFLEEAVVPYEGCNVGLCSWAFIKEKFSKLTKECNLDWCSDSTSSSAFLKATTWFVSLAAILSLRNYLNC